MPTYSVLDRILTWLVTRGEELFILTYTALQATFEDYEKVCRAAFSTFGFIDRR